jgi:hypothetical protein
MVGHAACVNSSEVDRYVEWIHEDTYGAAAGNGALALLDRSRSCEGRCCKSEDGEN